MGETAIYYSAIMSTTLENRDSSHDRYCIAIDGIEIRQDLLSLAEAYRLLDPSDILSLMVPQGLSRKEVLDSAETVIYRKDLGPFQRFILRSLDRNGLGAIVIESFS